MFLHQSIYSDNYFFSIGLLSLVSNERLNGNYFYVDTDSIAYGAVLNRAKDVKRIIVVASTDIDFYASTLFSNGIVLNKKHVAINMFKDLNSDHPSCLYRSRTKLSDKQRILLWHLLLGFTTPYIIAVMGGNTKMFLNQRYALMRKLNIRNKSILYNEIFRIGLSRKIHLDEKQITTTLKDKVN